MLLKRTLAALIMLLSIFSIAHLSSREKLFEDEKTFRIESLLPDFWTEYPLIEPSLPSNYEMKLFDSRALWGTKEDLEKYINHKDNIESEIITVEYSRNVIQSSPNIIIDDLEQFREDLIKSSMTISELNTFKWGEHPILSIELTTPNGLIIRTAWIGLNHPDGLVILLTHIPPKNSNESKQVWEDFLNKTLPLDPMDTRKPRPEERGLHVSIGSRTKYNSTPARKLILFFSLANMPFFGI